MRTGDRSQEALHAYYDGELRGWRRLRFERRLRRDASLRRELEALRRTSEWIRGSQPELASPDLWGGIAARLPIVEAELELSGALERKRGLAEALRWLLRPIPAGALATTAIAAVLALELLRGGVIASDVIRSLDPEGHRVMVLRVEDDVTVIWVFDEASRETSRSEQHDWS